jgi:drug/metabolite transporter (DMT)-like permease
LLHLDTAANRRIGIGLVTLTTLCFATLDACAKWLVQDLPVLQVVWLRFLFHVLLLSALLAPRYGMELVRVRDWKLQALRAAMLGSMTALNFWALQYLQLAETGAIQFSVPLLIALLSAWWLGERLGTQRWLAIIAGFMGVLLVIRPGSQAFHPAILLSVMNAILYAAFNMLTRRMVATESAASMQLMSALGATVLLAPWVMARWLVQLAGHRHLRPVRRARALHDRAGAPLCVGRHVGAFSLPADHLHGAVGLAGLRPGTQLAGGRRRDGRGAQRAVSVVAGDEARLTGTHRPWLNGAPTRRASRR